MIQQFLEAVRDGAPIITANQRLARAWRRLYDDHQRRSGRQSWTAPKILPWPAWIQTLWFDAVMRGAIPPSTRLMPHQAEAVWRSLIEQSPERDQILQPRQAATSAMSAWTLLQQFRVPWKKLHFAGHDDFTAFAGWARAFEQRCTAQNWIDDARLLDTIRLNGAVLPPRVLLGGFDEFTPQQKAFLDALRDAGCPHELIAPGTRADSVTRAPQLDRTAEVRAAAQWARRQWLANPGANIGVVFPDLEARRTVVERIFTEVFHPDWILGLTTGRANFHISLGAPLTAWPAIHAAFLLLKLTRPSTITMSDASAILRSRFISGDTRDADARARQDLELRRGRPTDIAPRRVLPELHTRWEALRREGPAERRPSEWIAVIDAFLEAAGWPGEHTASSAEYQSLQAWRDLLTRFATLDLVTPPITFGSAITRLRELAGDTQFQPEDPDAPVQITGALEAAGAGYDALWIAGLDDESWPQSARPHPFLPPALQMEYGMPHSSADREFDFAERTTRRLLATAPDITVSHAERDGDRALRASVLIRDLPTATTGAVAEPDAYEKLLRTRAPLEAVADHIGPAYESAHVKGGTSVLKNQAECPFRAFAQVRLGARPPEAGTLGVDAAEHGTVLHLALQLFWNEVRTHQRLTGMNPAELHDLIRRVARNAVDREESRDPLHQRFRELEVDRTELVLTAWLEVEMEREPFEVVRCEEKQTVPIGGLELQTRTDRIDQLRDGSQVIIDYKTGTLAPKLSTWEGDRLSEPQLPLYATAMNDKVGAVTFAHLHPKEARFVGLADSAVLPRVKPLKDDSIAHRITEWRTVLEGLAFDFRRGWAAVDPKSKSVCRFCGLDALCRVHEQSVAEGEEEA